MRTKTRVFDSFIGGPGCRMNALYTCMLSVTTRQLRVYEYEYYYHVVLYPSKMAVLVGVLRQVRFVFPLHFVVVCRTKSFCTFRHQGAKHLCVMFVIVVS
jgi:hypothetical protein